ncbi:hypothetical protein [Spartinivicinus ruber]|uniref:hypothetical protein n=1 Tax=Spartinivicinus ruber TaxID=2683272 RepID=UPI0013D63125|nr:hypothetical protein [Spartinivicinus ruber]
MNKRHLSGINAVSLLAKLTQYEQQQQLISLQSQLKSCQSAVEKAKKDQQALASKAKELASSTNGLDMQQLAAVNHYYGYYQSQLKTAEENYQQQFQLYQAKSQQLASQTKKKNKLATMTESIRHKLAEQQMQRIDTLVYEAYLGCTFLDKRDG